MRRLLSLILVLMLVLFGIADAKAKFTKQDVYRYCEARWDYYERRDGGYYPSKHDNRVLSEASTKFGISKARVEEIHGEVSRDTMPQGNDGQQLMDMIKRNKENPWRYK